ncbi:MAG: hypothetical protein DRG33_02435 [Deltaproteobacteria bacterium]|nr:MAG: hypothetical protein DRG33_02435 [Deltaproteobacteria bacterium]
MQFERIVCPRCNSLPIVYRKALVKIPFCDGTLEMQRAVDIISFIIDLQGILEIICPECKYCATSTHQYTNDIRRRLEANKELVDLFETGKISRDPINLSEFDEKELHFLVRLFSDSLATSNTLFLEELYEYNKMQAFEELCWIYVMNNQPALNSYIANLYLSNDVDQISEILRITNVSIGRICPFLVKDATVEQLKDFVQSNSILGTDWFQALREACRLERLDLLPLMIDLTVRDFDYYKPLPKIAEFSVTFDCVSCLKIVFEKGYEFKPELLYVIHSNKSTRCLNYLLRNNIIEINKLPLEKLLLITSLLGEDPGIVRDVVKDSLINIIENLFQKHKEEKLRHL